MSRQMSAAASLRSRSSRGASRQTGILSAAGSDRIGAKRDGGMRQSSSAPLLKQQLDGMGTSGFGKSMMLGSMAQTMGAKIASTLHHRGEHDVGAIVDPDDEHVYVPRAQWTQSHDHPLRANNAQWNQQHFMASELKRLHGEEKYKEYMKKEVDRQIQERTDNRARMVNEKQAYAALVNADAERHKQLQKKLDGENNQGVAMMLQGLTDQQNNLARRAHEGRIREAQEHAEMKMRTVQHLCEEMAENHRRKQQLTKDMQQGMQDNENRRIQSRIDRQKQIEAEQEAMRNEKKQDADANAISAERVRKKLAEMQARVDSYDQTAGQDKRDRMQAELNRLDNDEKKHLERTDTFLEQRARARERQRQKMLEELDRQSAACEQKRQCARLAKQADREAIQAATKRSLDQEMAKAAQKKREEQQLQQELRVMMVEREEQNHRDSKEGLTKPSSVCTMNMVMSKNGNPAHKISDLHKSMEAGRYMDKPLGREHKFSERRAAPADSPQQMKGGGKMPAGGSMLGGIVGTLGGGGGAVHSALMALGGPHIPKTTGVLVQDVKLDSHWHEGVDPEALKAGRREARRREIAKAEANRD